MVKEISNIVKSTLPVFNIVCGTAGAFMFRKFSLAAGYGVSGKVAGLLGKQQAAEEWNKISNDYWTLAKKDAFKNLTATIGIIALGIASNVVATTLLDKEEPQEQPGWFDRIPSLNTLCEYKKSALAAAGLGILYLGRAQIFKNYRNHLIVQRDNFFEEIKQSCHTSHLSLAKDKVKYIEAIFEEGEPISSYMTDIKKLNWWINCIESEKNPFNIKDYILSINK